MVETLSEHKCSIAYLMCKLKKEQHSMMQWELLPISLGSTLLDIKIATGMYCTVLLDQFDLYHPQAPIGAKTFHLDNPSSINIW